MKIELNEGMPRTWHYASIREWWTKDTGIVIGSTFISTDLIKIC